MKQEIYSCLKMLDSFRGDCVRLHNTHLPESAYGLFSQYDKIRELLEKNLTPEQLKYIPSVSWGKAFGTLFDEDKMATIQELISASGIAIAFLRSIEGSLQRELDEKEKELKLREKEVDVLDKLLKKSIEAVEQIPELRRSEIVAGIKKEHRNIEKNTKKPEILFGKTSKN